MIGKAQYSVRGLVAASLIVFAMGGCQAKERLPYYEAGRITNGSGSSEGDLCASPKLGCPCSEPGSVIACGEVDHQVDEYVTCTEGTRMCRNDRTWGDCSGETVVRSLDSSMNSRVQGLGSVNDCSTVNPCDPLCREVVDTGSTLGELSEYLCSTSLGLTVCERCGYERPTTALLYSDIPDAWQAMPSSCTESSDRCIMDTHCASGKCVPWSEPCQIANSTCTVDLTLGRPCVSLDAPNTSFHVPVCNRGRTRLDAGTVRIGVDDRAATLSQCATEIPAEFPNQGSIEFDLSSAEGWFIEPGHCIDVNAGNSRVNGLRLTDNRALVVNYDGALSECNRCNNSNVIVRPTAEGGGSTCAACTGLECSQSNVNTTLRGTVYDPAGRTPIPDVWVYVPNEELAQLSNASEATCDSCESLISGSPLTLTRADATGRFALTNVPANVRFPLVVQSGRWRREFTVDAIASGSTRWIDACNASASETGNSSADCGVAASEPVTVAELSRLRLPRTQRRCVGGQCGGEGDIPKLALIMGDGDPLQCLLRRIGVAESEMTASSGAGRIHLFNHNGMQIEGGQRGFGAGGLLENASQLRDYAGLLAPCDNEHEQVMGLESERYKYSIHRSGPSYNSPPNPTATAEERANVKAYVDAGGRLFTSHWLSMDFIHLNYSPPPKFALWTEDEAPLLSPFDASGFNLPTNIRDDLHAMGFEWVFRDVSSFNPDAPVVHLFGQVIEAAGNPSVPELSDTMAVYPHFDYTIDTSNPVGQTLSTWANAVGASPAGKPGTLRFRSWSPMVRAVRPALGVSRLAYGDTRNESSLFYEGTKPPFVPRPQNACLMYGSTEDNPYYCDKTDRIWGDEHTSLYQFDTPLASADKCGRVVAAQAHVTQRACSMPSEQPRHCPSDGSSHDCNCVTLPAASEWEKGCGDSSTALHRLEPDELAFEYLLFSTTQCMGDVVAPTRSVSLPVVAYERIIEANCDAGEHVQWQTFSIQATIPEGSSVSVSASTADTEQQLIEGDVDSVSVGTFTQSTSTWTSSEHTLETYFREQLDPPDVSRAWLKIRLTLTPIGGVAPTVSQWRTVFNCVSAE